MMENPVTLCCAPCCWGVDDVSNPNLPAWEKVLEEAASAGFGALELGPYGYIPLDVGRVSEALTTRGLSIIAGTIFDDLVSPSNLDKLLRQTEEICSLITALPGPRPKTGQRYHAPYLTVMDWGHDERDYAAGHSDRAPRLSDEAWHGMMDNIRAIAELASERFSVRATIHPHAGGYIEFEDELERLATHIGPETAGLCLDTGHLLYAGMDPVEVMRRHWTRVDYLHFKDIDAGVYKKVIGQHIRFFDACAKGVMCPIGRGVIDYPAIHALLTELGYSGYITIEQERDPQNPDSVLEDLLSSRAFLENAGFTNQVNKS